MRNLPDRRPYESYAGPLFHRHDAVSPVGKEVRRHDARKRLAEMDEAEAAVARHEVLHQQIADRIERRQTEHEFNMHYLIWFGVRADERSAFRRILEAVREHGLLSLQEAADAARQLCERQQTPSSKSTPPTLA